MKLYIRILAFIVILLLLWWLYNYLQNTNYTNISPIDRCSLKYDRERVYEFDDLLSPSESNMIIEMAKPKEYYIFSTCRLCYLNHSNIKLVSKLKELHSNYYTINNNNIYTQPVNYTIKLTDILDSILYMNGLYDHNIINNRYFKKMFFTFESANSIKQNTHPLQNNKPIIYDKCIFEVWNLDEYIFKNGPFKNKNLPFKIKSYHREYPKEDFNIIELNENEAHEKLKKIKELVNCPILIFGPYLSPTMSDYVNNKRKRTQKILKKICKIENIEYVDLTNEIIKDNTILISNPGKESDETHFTEKGTKIISNIVYNFLNKD
jgi:hypothetical protein